MRVEMHTIAVLKEFLPEAHFFIVGKCSKKNSVPSKKYKHLVTCC